ncbi:MAG: glycosyltransferase [Acetobacteraceae bacterium]|nr:glycosyltransferase [Acetobacteraceae bacterium]
MLTPSEQEAVVARQLEPAARVVAVAPFCFRTFGASRAPPLGARLLFVGGFAHTPNADALAWFVAEILPLIRARVPAARLLAAGSHVPARVWALSGPAVTIRPDVPPETLRRLYHSARVVVAPLRYGAGVKLKVVEALREGVPLVATGVGAQGLPGLARVACVTDDPARFVDAACRLLTDEAAWRERCAAQIAYAREHFSEVVLRDGLLRALDLAPDRRREIPVSASAHLPAAPASDARLAATAG